MRSAGLDPTGRVRTIVGLDLFVFGDTDGVNHNVRLEHPIGLDHFDGVLYVADTYNHKIKKVLAIRGFFSMLGAGDPSGVSIANGKMYIADTNNHLIRLADMETAEIATLELTGI